MKADLNLDWLDYCPEKMREEFRNILLHPPGTPAGARYFGYSETFDYYETLPDGKKSLSEEEAKREEEIHNQRQFAAAWGTYAEVITARHLIMQGLPIRERNWKPGQGKGEIDLITQRGNRIIFVEVKARSGTHTDPWEALTPRKIADLCHGADIYLKMQREPYDYQFDVALLTGKYDDYVFEYIEDAFMCPLKVRK